MKISDRLSSHRFQFFLEVGAFKIVEDDCAYFQKRRSINDEITMKKAPNEDIAKGVFIVRNDRGLHTRPSTAIVKCAASFSSKVVLKYQKIEINAKSLLGILLLSAEKGAKIRVIAKGKDADQAVASLLELADNNFNIHY